MIPVKLSIPVHPYFVLLDVSRNTDEQEIFDTMSSLNIELNSIIGTMIVVVVVSR